MYKPCKDKEVSSKLNWQTYYKDKREFERMALLSLMQDEQLVKEVRLYPTLYDKSDKGYKERILIFFGIGHFQQNL